MRQYTLQFKHQYMHPSASIHSPFQASIHASLCVNIRPNSCINTCIPLRQYTLQFMHPLPISSINTCIQYMHPSASMYAPIQAPIHASLCVNIRPNSSINTCIPLRQYTPQFKHQYMHPSASIHAPIQ
eukprot:337069_1